MRGRGTESEDVIRGRLDRTYEEMNYYPNYDYVVYNNAVEACVEDMLSIIHAEQWAVKRHPEIPTSYFET